jgi:hypothetical protein
MFEGKPIVIEGFELPYDDVLFLTVLTIHVAAGLICVVSGIFAMLAKKQKGTHTKSGKIYYWSLWVVFTTATLIAVARWKEDYHLFILGSVSFTAAFIARRAVKKMRKYWSIYHITGMGISYIFLLIAFYVDNGKFLPVWKELNPVIYWLLPLVIGIPLLMRTLIKNPFSRNYFRKT